MSVTSVALQSKPIGPAPNPFAMQGARFWAYDADGTIVANSRIDSINGLTGLDCGDRLLIQFERPCAWADVTVAAVTGVAMVQGFAQDVWRVAGTTSTTIPGEPQTLRVTGDDLKAIAITCREGRALLLNVFFAESSTRSVDFAGVAVASGPNPRDEASVVFEVLDAGGKRLDGTSIVRDGDTAGLASAATIRITLPEPTTSVVLDLLRQSGNASLAAWNINGSLADTEAPGEHQASIALTGEAIDRIDVRTPESPVLLTKLVYERWDGIGADFRSSVASALDSLAEKGVTMSPPPATAGDGGQTGGLACGSQLEIDCKAPVTWIRCDLLCPDHSVEVVARDGVGRALTSTSVGPTGSAPTPVRLSAPAIRSILINSITGDATLVRLSLPVITGSEPSGTGLSELSDGLSIPPALVATLKDAGVNTIADLRSADLPRILSGIPPDDPGRASVSKLAALSVLTVEPAELAALTRHGYDSPVAVGTAPETEFVQALTPEIGPEAAGQLHLQATAQTRFLDSVLAGDWVELASGRTPIVGSTPDGGGAPITCSCSDCDAAVGPIAYLADLLRYAMAHVNFQASAGTHVQPIDLNYLESNFHQPFGRLPADCSAMSTQVSQVRLCMEVLTRIGAWKANPKTSAAMAKYLRDAYAALLVQLGTSYDELRLVGTDPAARKALADRLGIALGQGTPDNLAQLTLKPSDVTADRLERLFGLRDLMRDPLSGGLVLGDDNAQIGAWYLNPVTWGQDTDPGGLIYVKLTRKPAVGTTPAQIQVELSRDGGQTVVASGAANETPPATVVPVGPVPFGTLSGELTITYQQDAAGIQLVAIPSVEAWRQQRLRSIWRDVDWPPDLPAGGRPVIDPDAIGPDDFRQPVAKSNAAAPDMPFDIWLRRRQWVDGLLQTLLGMIRAQGAATVPDASQMLAWMSQPVPYPGQAASVTPWPGPTMPADFDGIYRDLTQGDAAAAEKARERIASDLKLPPAAFMRLVELSTKDQLAGTASGADPVSADEWSEFRSILVQAVKTAFFPAWLQEEAATFRLVTFGPDQFWKSLREPLEGDWPPNLQSGIPLIDPELMALTDLAEPTVGARAIQLWRNRRAELDQVKSGLLKKALASGFDAMLVQALGDATLPAVVDQLALDLVSIDPNIVAAATATVEGRFHMSVPTFQQLVAIRKKAAATDPARKPTPQEWSQAAAILTTAGKLALLYATWAAEEADHSTGVQYWQALKARLPRWRASVEVRSEWESDLAIRSGSPLIDPDLIGPADILHPTAGAPDGAFDLWDTRRQALQDLVKSWSTKSLDQTMLDTLLRTEVGIAAADLTDLATQWAGGIDIRPRLDQLTLPLGAFKRLSTVVSLVAGGFTPDDGDTSDTYDILIQVHKRRQSAAWRAAEQTAGLTLGPDAFRIRLVDSTVPAPPPSSPWRYSARAFGDWQAALQSRIDEVQGVATAQQEAVITTESATLPPLRDVFVAAADPAAPDLETAARWVTENLLVDAAAAGCIRTTRIEQAIETIQALLFSLRNGQLTATRPELSLTASYLPQFDEEWPWMGSYATWRAAMFVFLYPENLLLPSLRYKQTPAFRVLSAALRSNRIPSPNDACTLATSYAEYFRDVCTLRLGASCFAVPASTRQLCSSEPTPPAYSLGDAGEKPVMYLFGMAGQRVYWSSYDDSNPTGYAQTFWEAVPGLDAATQVVGAAPYDVNPEKRYVVLFAKAVIKGELQLVCTKFNLQTASWDGEPTTLTGVWQWVAVVRQQLSTASPPQVAAQQSDGCIYSRSLNRDCSGWDDANWVLIVPRRKGAEVGHLVAMCDAGADDYLLIAHSDARQASSYRLLSDDALATSHDDGQWRDAAPGSSAIFRGALPYQTDCLLITNSVAVSIRSGAVGSQTIGDFNAFDTWLTSVAGVSLSEILVQFHDPNNPHNGWSVLKILQATLSGQATGVDGNALWTLKQTLDDPGDVGRDWAQANQVIAGFLNIPDKSILGAVQYILSGAALYVPLCPPQGSPIPLDTSFNELTIPPTSGTHGLALESRLVGIQRQSGAPHPGAFTCVLSATGLIGLTQQAFIAAQVSIAPYMPPGLGQPDPLALAQHWTAAELQARRAQELQIYAANALGPSTVLTYLQEGYYFVPVQFALALQHAGQYTAALDWYRSVYDYTAPVDRRKIYYGLTAEESLSGQYTRPVDWLLDPLNPHAIAATRPHCYSRYTILSVIRCFAAFADAEFTFDSAESLASARDLYLTAVDLLQVPDLVADTVSCATLIAGLDVPTQDPAWLPLVAQVKRQLRDFGDRAQLQSLIQAIGRTAGEVNAPAALFTHIEQLIHDRGPDGEVSRPTIAQVLESSPRAAAGQASLLAQPMIATATAEVGAAVAGHASSALGVVIPSVDGTPTIVPYSPSFPSSFCIAPNPVVGAVGLHIQLNLFKLRNCMNIAGLPRQVDPYSAATDSTSGLPSIGASGQIQLPGVVRITPTPYRYATLVTRAKEMVALAQQVEASYLSTLEKFDNETYNLLRARQDARVARATVRLTDLQVLEAQGGVRLATDQQKRAQIQVDHYTQLLDAGLLEDESAGVSAIQQAELFYGLSSASSFLNAAIQATVSYELASASGATLGTSMVAAAQAAAAGQGATAQGLSSVAALQQAQSSYLLTLASFERRVQDWQLAQVLAQQDVQIGSDQINLAQDHVRVVGQQREIASVQASNADASVEFLGNKFTSAELFDWMASVLEGVYSYFLQQATAVARQAANQLAFERQEPPSGIIQSDYWTTPGGDGAAQGPGAPSANRKGLTGAERLLQDLVQLDQYAFETNRRRLELTETISLASLAPAEFQRFRETGVLLFATPMDLFDRRFPGHYLRLIKQVRTTVIGLIPPTTGIRATLTVSGTSRVVVGGDVFETTVVRRDPESVSLTSPIGATGVFQLDPQADLLLPFEGHGVDTTWELHMPRAANPFDYGSLADVLISIDYTALDSADYRQQVLKAMDPRTSGDRPFSFRQDLPDAWYELHNPEQSATPMVVRFTTGRQDFPPNLDELRIQQVLLYFSRATDVTVEIPVTYLRFTESGSSGAAGGGALTVDGVVSTRRGNAGGWMPMLGKVPVGTWELSLAGDPTVKNLFENDQIQDILFVITYSALTPGWPS